MFVMEWLLYKVITINFLKEVLAKSEKLVIEFEWSYKHFKFGVIKKVNPSIEESLLFCRFKIFRLVN